MVGTPSFFSDYTVCRTILKFVNDKIEKLRKAVKKKTIFNQRTTRKAYILYY